MESKGYVDDERLAQVYIEMSAHCQKEAHELALGDVAPAREHTADASLQNIIQYHVDEIIENFRTARRALVSSSSKCVSVDEILLETKKNT